MKWFYNLRISSKLLVCFAILALFSALTGNIGFFSINSIIEGQKALHEQATLPLSYLTKIESGFQKIRIAYRDMIRLDDIEKIEEKIRERKSYSAEISKYAQLLERSLKDDEGRKLLNEFKENRKQFLLDLEKIEEFASADMDAEAIEFMEKYSLHRTTKQEMELINKLMDYNIKLSSKINAGNDRTARKATFNLFAMMGIIIISSVVMGIFTSGLIGKPVRQLAEAAREFSEGNPDVSITVSSQDETGKLASTFNVMIEKIKDEIACSRSFYHGIRSAFCITDLQSNILYINESALEIIGLEKEFSQNFALSDLLYGSSFISDALQEKFVKDEKHTINVLNGTPVPVLLQSGGIYNHSQQLVSVYFFFSDLRKLEAEQLDYLKNQIRPIAEILNAVAGADLSQKVNLGKSDNLFELGESINRMIDDLNSLISDIYANTERTSRAAENISISTNQMAAGAGEQSSRIIEIAQTVEEMTRSIQDTAGNISQVAELSLHAAVVAMEGSERILETREGMAQIASASDDSGKIISSLASKTEQIGEITLVIDEIADQTNLLALNAAIEAARAGEQGRGFAVVADEVRKLAERTNKATKEIALTIKSVQAEASRAESSMQQAKMAVARGLELTEKVAEAFSTVFTESEKVTQAITIAASATEEQSASAKEINMSIEAISGVLQQNASATEEISATVEELNRMAGELKNQLGVFRLRADAAILESQMSGITS